MQTHKAICCKQKEAVYYNTSPEISSPCWLSKSSFTKKLISNIQSWYVQNHFNYMVLLLLNWSFIMPLKSIAARYSVKHQQCVAIHCLQTQIMVYAAQDVLQVSKTVSHIVHVYTHTDIVLSLFIWQSSCKHIDNKVGRILTESFRLSFTVNVEWSCDWKSNVNVHGKRSAVKVVSDQRTCTILSLKPLVHNC